jgi:phospholipid/cholesterol/gamma-HCH transport system substrate-binding protein
MKRAIKAHRVDFLAIVFLLVLSGGVSFVILHNERLRFPFIDQPTFPVNAVFSTAQAVTPGQGQTVRVSGVQIGDIAGVTLQNGYAVVRMDIQNQYDHLIHHNASALLRPKTGLKDMFVELDPGTAASPVVQPGFTIPASQTEPDINLDEVLSSLDTDTRQYLQLLVNGAGQGLAGQGDNLAQVLERFEPTHQDLARVSQALAVRGTDLRQLVNSLQRLNTALIQKGPQLADLVSSSSTVFHAFASEDANISRAVGDLPSTLSVATSTLGKVQTFAGALRPATVSLLPAVRKLPAANSALEALAKPSTPIVRNQIRPFVIAARPLVRNLRPASVNLAAATPNLSKVFTVLNHLVNMLGYNPGDTEHGYLFWLAWLGHNARSLFSIQDANGVYRPLFLQLSCSSISQIVNQVPALGSILNLTPILTDAGLCAAQAAAIAASADSRTGVLRAGAQLTTAIPHLPTPGIVQAGPLR